MQSNFFYPIKPVFPIAKEHVTEIPAGNIEIKADLKKHNEVINTKTVTPVVEKEHTPTNLNMYLLTPLAIIDTALLIEILRNITRHRRKKTYTLNHEIKI